MIKIGDDVEIEKTGSPLDTRIGRVWETKPDHAVIQLIGEGETRAIPYAFIKREPAIKYYCAPNEDSKPARILSIFRGYYTDKTGCQWAVYNPVGIEMSVWYRLEATGKRTQWVYAPQGFKCRDLSA